MHLPVVVGTGVVVGAVVVVVGAAVVVVGVEVVVGAPVVVTGAADTKVQICDQSQYRVCV